MNERLVRKDIGEKLDAERDRKGCAIIRLIREEAVEGHLYTSLQFAEKFENTRGLGGKDTIRDRISILATKRRVKFLRDGSLIGFPKTTSRFGYLCVEGMKAPSIEEQTDPETGEVTQPYVPVVPDIFKCPNTGVALPDARPDKWGDNDEQEGDEE